MEFKYSYGQVENAEVWKPKYGNKVLKRSMETEVRSEKKSCLSVFSVLLSHGCVFWGLVTKRWLYPCNVRAGSYALGLQCVSPSQIMHVTAKPKPTARQMMSGPTMQALCSWILLTLM